MTHIVIWRRGRTHGTEAALGQWMGNDASEVMLETIADAWIKDGKYWLELQRLQHSIQQTLEQTRDPSRKFRSPTVVLEQLRDRIRSVSLDMHAFNRSCCVETATSSAQLAPRRPAVRLHAPEQRHRHGGRASAKRRNSRTTTNKTRRTQRRRKRSDKQACCDTIEESSLVVEVDARRKRPRYYKESP